MRFEAFMTAAGGAVVGAVATIATGASGYLNQDRALDIEMVRVSLSILSGENKDTSLPGRRFALRSLAKYADVPIPSDEFDEWARRGTIPDVAPNLGFASYGPLAAYWNERVIAAQLEIDRLKRGKGQFEARGADGIAEYERLMKDAMAELDRAEMELVMEVKRSASQVKN